MKLSAIQILLGVFAGQTIAAVLDPRSNAMVERRGRDFGRYNYVSKNQTRVQGPFHFHQNIDHRNPGLGTFLQRYWVKDTYYGYGRRLSSGGFSDDCPIFLLVGDEASGRISLWKMEEDSMIVRMAKENKANIVLLEHRYFGQSYPVENLSDDNMKYLTIEQTLADLNHFATQGMGSSLIKLKPDKHPWVLIGGSYAGALVNWALQKYGKTFYAGYSSSGTVQAKVELWEYWDNIQSRMELESKETIKCLFWVQELLEEFHEASIKKDHTDMNRIRIALKMVSIPKLADMAHILSKPLERYPQAEFFEYCKKVAKSETLDEAMTTIGEWNKEHLKVEREPSSWTSYDPQSTIYDWQNLDLSSDKTDFERQWAWLRCNELGWFFTAPPSNSGKKTQPIVSKYLTAKRDLRVCSLYFPTLESEMTLEAITQKVENTNKLYGGFNKRAAKLIDVNGKYDPWLSVTFQSPNSPAMYRNVSTSTLLVPGYHNQDMGQRIKGKMDTVQLRIQKIIGDWLKEWSPPA